MKPSSWKTLIDRLVSESEFPDTGLGRWAAKCHSHNNRWCEKKTTHWLIIVRQDVLPMPFLPLCNGCRHLWEWNGGMVDGTELSKKEVLATIILES